MAYYEITRACGHVEDVNITGTNVHGEREQRARWLATQDCSGCYRARREDERVRVADEWLGTSTLPPLSGSERQVEWAERIRTKGIATIVGDVTDPPAGLGKSIRAVKTGHTAVAFGPALELLDEQDRAVVAHLLIDVALRQRTARWWIDNRDHITGSTIDAMTEDEHTKLARLLGHR